MKQFAPADQRDPIVHQPEAGLEPPDGIVQLVGRRHPRRAEQFAQSIGFGLRLTDDEHVLKVGLAGPHRRIELIAHLGDVAAETLDRLDAPGGTWSRANRPEHLPRSPTRSA